MTLRLTHKRAGQRWAGLIAVVAVVLTLAGGAVLAVHDVGEFELDKNATGDLDFTKLGDLGANVNATTTTIPVCRTATAEPATPFTILIEAERMQVTAVADGSFGGNCAGAKRSYTVARGVSPTTAASHQKGDVKGFVSLLSPTTQDGPDWNQVHTSVTADPNDEGDDDKCISLGLVECAFVADGIGPTTFIGGASKDHLPISGWQHTNGSSPDKAEILNAYAAKAVDDNDDQILYFGMDRYAVDGSTDIGFWFFRGEVIANGDGTFSGEHQGTLQDDGDILALATFTQGGAATNIRVFRWVGSGGNESGTIQGPDADAGDCLPGNPPLTDDEMCGTVNNTTIEVPWTYTFKGAAAGKWVPAGGFFEGGINLTELGLDGCFSSFLAETRSSPEITAILKDFALGSFEACDTELTTTPSDDGGTALTDSDEDDLPDIQIGTGSAGVDVSDSALLDVKGTSTWSGTLDFYLCGPIASGTCDEDGLLVDSQSVSDADGTTTYTSDTANVTEVGRYCWRGEFTSATQGVPDAADAGEGECFEVLPLQPTLDTQAVDAEGNALTDDVPFGDAVYDKATLSGTAYQPGTDGPDTTYPSINATMDTPANGTITFTLVGPGDCSTVATGDGDNPETGVTVSGDDDYQSSGFTPDAPGDYHWQASYSGDSPNTLGATHNDECDDTDEDVTVEQLQPTMDTAQEFVPNDSATITVAAGAGDLDGSVIFKLYVDDATCAGTAAYTSAAMPVSDTDDAGDTELSDTVTSDNTTAYSVTGTTFHWVVEFTSNTSAHLDVSSGCGNEHSSVTIDNGSTQPATP